VVARGPTTDASSSTIRNLDFDLRPKTSPNDVLRVVPGLLAVQHQGGGKADQLFLRGFDADHGTDVSVNFDGVPVNLPSHAHGQGYADLHFLIPESIERIEVSKGPYFAELGDFDTAGAVNLLTRDKFERSQVSIAAGVFPTLSGSRDDGSSRRFNGYRVLGIASADQPAWFAAELYGAGGPFLHSERLQRYNLLAKASAALSPRATVSLLATAYASSWIGSGQIPARLVDAGMIDRYGSIDPTEGGDTQRQGAIAALTPSRREVDAERADLGHTLRPLALQ
jgi:outer membrane receptor protein involved in Fe transport